MVIVRVCWFSCRQFREFIWSNAVASDSCWCWRQKPSFVSARPLSLHALRPTKSRSYWVWCDRTVFYTLCMLTFGGNYFHLINSMVFIFPHVMGDMSEAYIHRAIWYLWYIYVPEDTYNIRYCYSRQFIKNDLRK